MFAAANPSMSSFGATENASDADDAVGGLVLCLLTRHLCCAGELASCSSWGRCKVEVAANVASSTDKSEGLLLLVLALDDGSHSVNFPASNIF